jgi:hypothetical protein
LGGILWKRYVALASGPVPNHRARRLCAERRPIVATISREAAAELHRLSRQADEAAQAAGAISVQLGGLIQRLYINPAAVGMDDDDVDAFCQAFVEEAEGVTA